MRRAIDKDAAKHVLRKLIALAHQEMMNGDGDDENAGDKIKEAMGEGSPAEEASESPDVEVSEQAADDGDEENFSDYKKREMKRGNKSPIKDRKVAVMMLKAGPKAVGGGKGRF